MELFLVRHGQPTEEAAGRCYGTLDVGLAAAGRQTAETLAARLAAEPVARVLSSPRQRARDTARPIAAAHGVAVEVVDDLRELDFGSLEGMTYDEVAATHPDLYARWMREPTTVAFPGGESYADLAARVGGALARLRAETLAEARVVAVAHGGVVRAALALVLGIPPANVFRLAVDYGSTTRIAWLDGEPLVRSVNEPP